MNVTQGERAQVLSKASDWVEGWVPIRRSLKAIAGSNQGLVPIPTRIATFRGGFTRNVTLSSDSEFCITAGTGTCGPKNARMCLYHRELRIARAEKQAGFRRRALGGSYRSSSSPDVPSMSQERRVIPFLPAMGNVPDQQRSTGMHGKHDNSKRRVLN
ncbi:hypothetical protein CISG_00485 [Coccidioides immitis RMSCC 3703]|uniref:Uncharacterized protein n=1 Tax=Coccidioides immitis RMSCC 3703 TaxID=454286 RepID=A0A0J8QI95_COCIT|nr:hypothetical protein CISG_00485 [Coccidioides immitis RMSCC 3703]